VGEGARPGRGQRRTNRKRSWRSRCRNGRGFGASARAHAARKRTRPSPRKGSGKPPGKQLGSPGHGRTQKLAVTDHCAHRPENCAACGAVLAEDAESQAYTAWDEIDIAPPVEGRIGLMFSVTRHTLLEVRCACGHVSRAMPWRAPPDAQWEKVELGEWRLVGPRLAGVIVLLALRMRLSRASIRELLREVFDLSLSTGVIDETIREAGRGQLPAGGCPGRRHRAGGAVCTSMKTSWSEIRRAAVVVGAGQHLYGAVPHRPHVPREMLEKRPCRTAIPAFSSATVYVRLPKNWEKPPALLAPPDCASCAGLAESSDGRVSRVGQRDGKLS
jgi:hypothetical protein